MDQSFLHSDLITYDVPAVWDGRFFRLENHIARLDASCGKIRPKAAAAARKKIKRILMDMLATGGIRDAFVELIVTRGFKGVGESRGEKILR